MLTQLPSLLEGWEEELEALGVTEVEDGCTEVLAYLPDGGLIAVQALDHGLVAYLAEESGGSGGHPRRITPDGGWHWECLSHLFKDIRNQGLEYYRRVAHD